MIRILAVAAALAVFSFATESTAQAQNFVGGYQFGTGVNVAGGIGHRGFGCNGYSSREQLPYFAKFPPVYYSHIVKRPYGISPFAAPSGIAPVEMSYPAPAPVSIKNPYFKSDVSPAKTSPSKPKKTENKAAQKIINPFVELLVGK